MNRIIWGVCLIFLGIGMFGSITGIFNILFKGWWTIFIIIPAIVELSMNRRKTWGLVLLTVGITLLMQQQGIISGNMIWKILVAFGIIFIGINMIFYNRKKHVMDMPLEILDNNLGIHNVAFGNQEIRYDNQTFTGTEMSALFGGIKLNLIDAIINQDVVIKISAVFGGCEVIVPDNVNVKVENSGFIGGAANKRKYINPGHPTIYIKSSTVFGGVDIK